MTKSEKEEQKKRDDEIRNKKLNEMSEDEKIRFYELQAIDSKKKAESLRTAKIKREAELEKKNLLEWAKKKSLTYHDVNGQPKNGTVYEWFKSDTMN